MFGRVRRAVFEANSGPLLPTVVDREAFVRDGRAGDGAARTFEGVSLMGLAARADPRLPHSRAGIEGASPREPSDAGVDRRGDGRDGAQGRGLTPGVGAGGDTGVDGAGIHVRACQRRSQPDRGLGLRLLLRTCLLVVPGLLACWFNVALAADFRVNPQEIPKFRELACFGEQAAKNVLARLLELQTVYKLPLKKAHERLGFEMLEQKRKEFEDCFIQKFAIYPDEFGIVLDVEELGLGSWGDLPPYYFVQATVEYKGKFYSEKRDGAPVFAFVDGSVVQKINPAAE